MPVLAAECPHCLTEKAAFNVLAASQIDSTPGCFDVFGRCPVCLAGTVFRLISFLKKADPMRDDRIVVGNAASVDYRLICTFPALPKPEAPADVPERIAEPFLSGERAFLRGDYSPAAVMYRKAVERAVKTVDPEGTGTLHNRIEALRKASAFPQGLIDLMHLAKFIGNDGAHDDADPTRPEVEHGRDFTRLLLVYLFELPARVDRARGERSTAGRKI